MLLQVAFEQSRGGQSVDMICRELMLDEEKTQTPKRPRAKKKKGGLKPVSQPVEETRPSEAPALTTTASKTTSSCLVRWQYAIACMHRVTFFILTYD